MARLRKKDLWQTQAAALIAGVSVAKAAEQCGVAYTTAFRWRHRFLAAPATDKPNRMVGIVEAVERRLSVLPAGQEFLTIFCRLRENQSQRRLHSISIMSTDTMAGTRNGLDVSMAVATKFLDRYLGWRRMLEAIGPTIQSDAVLRAAVGLGPYQQVTR